MKLELPDNTWRPPKKANMIECPVCGAYAYAWMRVSDGEHYYHEVAHGDELILNKEVYGGPVVRTSICEVKNGDEVSTETQEDNSESAQV